MNRKWLIRVGLAAVANAVVLWIADLLLTRFEIGSIGLFIIAVVIFTAVTLLVKPLAEKVAGRFTGPVTYLAGVVTTWLALLVTDILSRGIQIEGFMTWVMAVVIVWLGSLAYDLVDDKLIAGLNRKLPGSGARPAGSH